jgi:hypothetical protein
VRKITSAFFTFTYDEISNKTFLQVGGRIHGQAKEKRTEPKRHTLYDFCFRLYHHYCLGLLLQFIYRSNVNVKKEGSTIHALT